MLQRDVFARVAHERSRFHEKGYVTIPNQSAYDVLKDWVAMQRLIPFSAFQDSPRKLSLIPIVPPRSI